MHLQQGPGWAVAASGRWVRGVERQREPCTGGAFLVEMQARVP